MDPLSQNELNNLKNETRPEVLLPRLMDIMYRSRVVPTSYASTGGTRMVIADEMLEFEWQGRIYVLPVYRKK